jgi:hypothetical protein
VSLYAVSQQVLTAVYNRLSDPVTGFNPGVVTNAPNYGITNPLQVDWSPSSMNFTFGQIDPSLVDDTGILTYPFVTLYTKESAQDGNQRFTQFSGIIRAIFECNLSFIPIKGQQNFEAYGNMLEDVVIDVINRTANQNWGKPITYNGQIQCKRGPVLYGAENFKQQVGFSMLFRVDLGT